MRASACKCAWARAWGLWFRIWGLGAIANCTLDSGCASMCARAVWLQEEPTPERSGKETMKGLLDDCVGKFLSPRCTAWVCSFDMTCDTYFEKKPGCGWISRNKNLPQLVMMPAFCHSTEAGCVFQPTRGFTKGSMLTSDLSMLAWGRRLHEGTHMLRAWTTDARELATSLNMQHLRSTKCTRWFQHHILGACEACALSPVHARHLCTTASGRRTSISKTSLAFGGMSHAG